MIEGNAVSLFRVIAGISNAMDLVSPLVTDHHNQVAFIALNIADQLGLPSHERTEVALAGAIHDIGALSLHDRISSLSFETETARSHAYAGYLLLSSFEPLRPVADLVRFHHTPWKDGEGVTEDGYAVPLGSHLLHLADRVAVLIDRKRECLSQGPDIIAKIRAHSGTMFAPQLVEAFESASSKESFWLDATSPWLGRGLHRRVRSGLVDLDMAGLAGLARLFSRAIDFRNPFTASHSSGVAAVARMLAKAARFSDREQLMIEVAGHLHDLGKLAVPIEILEKAGPLTATERSIIKGHTFHTYRTLEAIDIPETITTWAAYHHERLDGTGYPFRLNGSDLPLGSRIVAVADVFTALVEDRPYRNGMDPSAALRITWDMANESALDPDIVNLLAERFEEIDAFRAQAQSASSWEYSRFSSGKSLDER